MKNKLRKGYTTGVHASFAFKSALDTFIRTKQLSVSKTIKIDNDDLDITKGCEIIVTISDDFNNLILNKIKHKPHIISYNHSSIKIYAGIGIGIVTKDGLKICKSYPAINPKPLSVLNNIFKNIATKDLKLFCTISISSGDNLAKKTANSKVGIFGGLSILGTTGWVKPISATAYIQTIHTEILYAKTNKFNTIIFILGNTALQKVLKLDSNIYYIEIGNYIYDGINIALQNNFTDIQLWIGIAKAVKISQGFKNTHNRFGQIDFKKLQQYINIDISQCITIKRIHDLLGDDSHNFDTIIKQLAQKQLRFWFNKDIKVKIC